MQPPILLPVWPIVTLVTQHGPLAHLPGPCDSPAFPLLLSCPCSGYLDLPVTSVKKLKSFESQQNRELQAVTAKASFTGLLWSLYSKIAQGSKQGQRSNDKHMKQFSSLSPDVLCGQKVLGLNEAVCITPLRELNCFARALEGILSSAFCGQEEAFLPGESTNLYATRVHSVRERRRVYNMQDRPLLPTIKCKNNLWNLKLVHYKIITLSKLTESCPQSI